MKRKRNRSSCWPRTPWQKNNGNGFVSGAGAWKLLLLLAVFHVNTASTSTTPILEPITPKTDLTDGRSRSRPLSSESTTNNDESNVSITGEETLSTTDLMKKVTTLTERSTSVENSDEGAVSTDKSRSDQVTSAGHEITSLTLETSSLTTKMPSTETGKNSSETTASAVSTKGKRSASDPTPAIVSKEKGSTTTTTSAIVENKASEETQGTPPQSTDTEDNLDMVTEDPSESFTESTDEDAEMTTEEMTTTTMIPREPPPTVTASQGHFYVKWTIPKAERDDVAGYQLKVKCEAQSSTCDCQFGVCKDFTTKVKARAGSTDNFEYTFQYHYAFDYEIYVVREYKNGSLEPYTEPYSDRIPATTPNAPDPQTTNNPTHLDIRWSYKCPYTGPVNYTLMFEGENKMVKTSDNCNFEVRIPNLEPYSMYHYDLSAENGCGSAAPSCIDPPRFEGHGGFGGFGGSFPLYGGFPYDYQCRRRYKRQVNTRGPSRPCGICYKRCISTPPTAPSTPRNLIVTTPDFENEENGRYSYVDWEEPEKMNGRLDSYKISATSTNDYNTCIVDERGAISSPRCQCSRTACYIVLRPDRNYTITVQARNRSPATFSEPATGYVQTHTGVPPTPSRNSFRKNATENDKEDTTYSIIIDPNKFDAGHGQISKFKIFLNKVEGNKPLEKNRGWLEDEKTDGQLVFITNITYSNNVGFVFGADGPECKSTEVCNKVLEDNTEYFYKIRVYTSKGYADSETKYFKTKKTPLHPALVAFLFIMSFAIVAVTAKYGYKRHLAPLKPSVPVKLPVMMPSAGDSRVQRRILLIDLASTINSLLEQGQLKLSQEYADLRSVCPKKSTDYASLSTNAAKNRYVNILPFDETRVKLREFRYIECSDYINACYIHGYKTSAQFIACQGPKEMQVEDFWRMIWEKKVYVIVMVTQCIEGNTNKCCQYWPNPTKARGLEMPGIELNVRTVLESSREAEGYIFRKFELSKERFIPMMGQATRTIQHFHFVGWPDMGCPSTPNQLLNFVQTVRAAVPKESSHTVVHCSAGVGRTGTFIGLSNLIDEMKDSNSVDIFYTVYKMRNFRFNMVQTMVQYSFLYKCVLQHYMNIKGQTSSSENNVVSNATPLVAIKPSITGASLNHVTNFATPNNIDQEYEEDVGLEELTDDEEEEEDESDESDDTSKTPLNPEETYGKNETDSVDKEETTTV